MSVCDVFSLIFWYFVVLQENNCVSALHSVYLSLCQASQIICGKYCPCFSVLVALNELIYSRNSPAFSSIRELNRILRYCWFVASEGLGWTWFVMCSVPTSFNNFPSHILCLVGYLYANRGMVIIGLAYTLGGTYSFSLNKIWFWNVGGCDFLFFCL